MLLSSLGSVARDVATLVAAERGIGVHRPKGRQRVAMMAFPTVTSYGLKPQRGQGLLVRAEGYTIHQGDVPLQGM